MHFLRLFSLNKSPHPRQASGQYLGRLTLNNNFMSKNVAIGVLIVILVIFIGYFAYKSGEVATVDTNATSTVDVVVVPVTPSTPGTPSPVPSAPSADTATVVVLSNTTAVVSGKVNPHGAPTVYWYEYGQTSNLGGRTSNQNIGSGYSSITSPGYITGLKSKTQYYFRLNAQNAYGVTHGTTYNFTTTDNTVAPPAASPTIQVSAATNVTRDRANINGKVDAKGFATAYWFEFGETSSLGSLTGFENAGNSQSPVSVTALLSNLKPLTKYYFKLNAQNQFGTVNSSILSFTTAGPAIASDSQPSVKTNAATNVATSSVTMNGRVDPNGADTTYWFEYSKDALLGKIIGTATPDQTMNGDDAAIGVKADVSNLSRNTKYYYRLLARNSQGTVVGDIVSFRTK